MKVLEKVSLTSKKDRMVRTNLNEFLDYHKSKFDARVSTAVDNQKNVNGKRKEWIMSERKRAETKENACNDLN
jgi:hypothetical protein